MLNFEIVEIVFLGIVFLISISIHEFSHAYVSHQLGDPTPKIQGRVSSNPLKHIDILGFVFVFLINFGWGKPVTTNPVYYKRPLRDQFLVAIAGPFSNIILAVLGVFVVALYGIITGIENPVILYHYEDLFLQFFFIFSIINIILALFNLLPLPPLDGFRIIKFFNPELAKKIESYLLYILIGIIIILIIPGVGENIGIFLYSVGEKIFEILFVIVTGLLY